MRLLRSPLSVLGFVGVLVSAPALAQQVVEYPAGCDESKVSRGDHDRAHTVFLSGKQYLEESNYDKAISYFIDAYSIDCSVHAMLPIIATAYERKGDKAEAIRALGEYLKRAPGAPDHEIIEHRIRNLREQLTREQPASGPSAAPPTLPPAPAPVLTPAPTAPIPTVPEPPPAAQPQPGAANVSGSASEPGGGPGAGPWVLGGLGGAAIATGVIMIAIGAGDVSDATKDCPNHMCATDAEKAVASQKQSNGYALENAGIAVGIVGAAGVLGGVLWGVVGAPHAKESARVTPVVSPGYWGIAIDDHF